MRSKSTNAAAKAKPLITGDKSAPTTELAFRSFIRTMGLFQRTMEPYFVGFGISGAQWGILRSLRRAEDAGQKGLRLTDLGKALLVRPPSITGVVDRLERMDLVTRLSDTFDKRSKTVVLTPKGRAMLDRVLMYHPAQMKAVLGGLNPAEIKQLYALTQKMTEHLEGFDQVHPTATDRPSGNVHTKSSTRRKRAAQ